MSQGLQESSYGRKGFAALFDHMLGLLIEKHETIKVIYGSRVASVTPFYSASFPKDYHNLPAIILTSMGTIQEELGVGQMAAGTTYGDYLGIHNITTMQVDIWARNRLELEVLTDAVTRTFQVYKRDLYAQGIRDLKVTNITDRVFDPNAQRAWWGASQATGELWLKVIDYIVRWDDVWSPNVEGEEGGIERIDVEMDIDGATVTTTVGLVTLGLLDSMYLSRQLGRGIKILRTGGRY